MRKMILVVVASLAAADLADAQQDSTGQVKLQFHRPSTAAALRSAPLVQPALCPQSVDGTYQLTAEEADMAGPDPDEATGHRSVRLYSYNAHPVGPTIVAHRGRRLKISLRNILTPKPADEPQNPDVDQPHGFDVTNLHTHGLNVSPCGRADDVFREVRRHAPHTFVYHLPPDQPPGTYFYHPHKHGSVGYQVTCGMVGALIVRDEAFGLDAVPAIRDASDSVLVFQQISMSQDSTTAIWSLTPSQFYQGQPPPTEVVHAVNGQIAPTITLRRNEVVRWRLIHGGIAELIRLTIGPASGSSPPVDKPKIYHIAHDGIPFDHRQELTAPLEMAPGNRDEVLVKAPPADGDFLLISAKVTAAHSLRGVDQGPVTLAHVRVRAGAGPYVTDLPDDSAIAQKVQGCIPAELKDAKVTLKRTFELKVQNGTFQINGESFDPNVVTDVFVKDRPEEWTLQVPGGGRNGHPFHVHVNPFEIIAEDGKPLSRPLWADTLFIPSGHSRTVRTTFRHFTGKMVLHCHILDHEDKGMMHAVAIATPGGDARCPPGIRRPAPPVDDGEAMIPTPSFEVVDGNQSRLMTVSGRAVVIFFQGAYCPRCVSQLKRTIEARRTWAGGAVPLIAVSSEPIEDPSRFQRMVGVRPSDPVFLCIDTKLVHFREMGCEDDGPLHGVAVLDGGRIVWKVAGPEPFTDLAAVRSAVENERRVDLRR